MIARFGTFLLKRIILLFIDDNQSEIGQRHKNGTARANDNRKFTAQNRTPDSTALGLGQSAMPDGNLILKFPTKTGGKVRCQSYFWHQNERRAPLS